MPHSLLAVSHGGICLNVPFKNMADVAGKRPVIGLCQIVMAGNKDTELPAEAIMWLAGVIHDQASADQKRLESFFVETRGKSACDSPAAYPE